MVVFYKMIQRELLGECKAVRRILEVMSMYLCIYKYCRPCVQVETSGYELERLYGDVTSLCSRIELLPCGSARDRLAQSGKRPERPLASHWPTELQQLKVICRNIY